ncbi:MAG: alkaline phosphatase family protein [Bacteroidota bacterium]|nr:alkaline phosphatase family protein [Bacteroidota bacterium]
MKSNKSVFCSLLFICLCFSAIDSLLAQTNNFPKEVGPQTDKSFLVPTNQLIKPAGSQVYFPGRPLGLNLIRNGNYLLMQNIHSLDLVSLADKTVVQSLHLQKGGTSFNGLYTSKDESTIYLSQANDRVLIAHLNKSNILSWHSYILLPKPIIGGDPVPGGIALNQHENKMFVTLSRNNTLAIVNLKDSSVSQIPVGIAPYGVILKSDSKAYVSNLGGRKPNEGESTYNSSGSQVLVNPENGVANNGSVSVIDLNINKQVKEIQVGLHPSGMILSPDKSRLYVACANSDVITVINTTTDKVAGEISVHSHNDMLFGSAPNALAISPDGKFLYVANGTENAVSVIETSSHKVLGNIPTGWYPGAVLVNKAGNTLYIANVKGIGSRDKKPDREGYRTRDFTGSITIVKKPTYKELQKMTHQVKENNSFDKQQSYTVDNLNSQPIVAVPHMPGQKSHFKHVVYIIKENRVYDQVFGDMKQGNGDPNLVLFGRQATPNHHKLAENFVLLDNYYCSGVLSADGHQWATEAYTTDYLEKSFGDFARSYPYDGDDALAYASSGFLWNNVLKHGLTFRNYGEFVEGNIHPSKSTFMDVYNDFKKGTGLIKITAKANLDQIKPYLCPTYIGFPQTVPDVYRASEFIKELHQFEKNDSFPNFTIMLLPCDHTSGTRPGMPTTQSSVADNDLALGQIVEAISNSKFWKETCIFVSEDDSQDGLDHVDSHRTVGLVISPYTKRGKVISKYYSQISMVKTIENILGLPPMNQMDKASGDMSECFTETPDFTPYKVLPNNIPLDQLNPPLQALTGKKRYWALKSLQQNLDDYDRVDESVFNRIIWHSVKGYNTPYPSISKVVK